jgi:hypothetical protein
METKKDYTINIRVSKETEQMAREICENFKVGHGVDVTLSAYLRGIIETYVREAHMKIKK